MIWMCHCAFTAIGSLADLHFTAVRFTDPIAKYYLSSLAQVFFPSRTRLSSLSLKWWAKVNGLSVLPVGVKSFGATMLLALGLSKCIIRALQCHTRKIKSTLYEFGSEYLLHCLLQIFICSSFKMVISQQFTSSPGPGYQMAFWQIFKFNLPYIWWLAPD